VVTGAPGTISTLIRKYPDHILVKHETKELQNTTTMGTEHILLKVRMLKCKSFIMGNNITWTIYCDHRTDATIYTLKTWFVSVSLWIHWINKIYNNNNNNTTYNSQKKFRIKKFQNDIFKTVPSSKKDELGHSTYCTI
jgi:hypothetical protein